ncbi:hypothetical protein P3T76_005618 [Phytophthora citrophthora]|uniref:RxLR effector PexRD54 WY domain-containing protein n=1 Tax=Phytophthora citrophthora TaxID=4793 RepID=A0AAD9LNY9_9STRA|nr:hypothetical protein P3T76_005618 [Phytophthora citrophthora]
MRLQSLLGVTIALYVAAILEAFSTVSAGGVSTHTERASFLRTLRVLRTRNLNGNGEEERMGGGGITVSTSEKLATLFKSSKVTDEQLTKWLAKGKSADDVFYRMKFAKARVWIFDNPQFSRWVQYADDFSATPSGKGTSAIASLTTQYGDDRLYKMLKAAKRESSSKELASRLQTDQLERWITIGKDTDEVYMLYDLNYAGVRLLRDPQFNAWAKYVDDLNAKHKGAISMVPTLRKHYSDADLFKMAEAAKSGDDELKAMGLKLEDAFVQFWIRDDKTPVKVLAELQLGATTKTLESPLFGLLTKFTDAYNVKSSKMKTTMIETFTDAFGDEKVAKMLTTVQTNEWKAKKIATELEAAQLQMWLSSGKSVDEVYNLLNLPNKKHLHSIDANPLFTTWISYLNTFSIENPDKVTRLLSTLTTEFNNRPLMQILQAAEKFPSMKSIATKLQLQQAEKFFSTGVSPYKVFTAIALDSVGDSVLSSPVFTKWMSYVDDFNKKHPEKEESWFLPLRVSYQGNSLDRLIGTARKKPETIKLADMVEKARMEEWLTRWKYEPKDVFRFLHLNEAGDKTFSSPNFKLWVKYLNDFNLKYPDEKTTMIDNIRANYIDLHLLEILPAAKKVPSTEKLAKDLENALLNKWVDEKLTMAYLKRWLGYNPSFDVWIQRYAEKLNMTS